MEFEEPFNAINSPSLEAITEPWFEASGYVSPFELIHYVPQSGDPSQTIEVLEEEGRQGQGNALSFHLAYKQRFTCHLTTPRLRSTVQVSGEDAWARVYGRP